MSIIKDLTGVKFGEIEVLEQDFNYAKEKKLKTATTYWKCKCSCGNVFTTSRKSLQAGKTQCSKHVKKKYTPHSRKLIDLTGQKFGKLTVIERDFDYVKKNNLKQKIVYWKCKCDCGNEITVAGQSLRSGYTIQCSLCKRKDETGKRYGKLIVLGPAEKKSKGSSSWLCQCDCGKQTIVHGWDLRSGNTTSCGCYFQEIIRSRKLIQNEFSEQELEVLDILKENNFNFLYDEPYFKDLLSINGGICRYDFILFNENKEVIRLLEIDGEQHFKPIKFFGGEEGFEKIKKNDEIKNNYALEHNYPLVRIPYTEKNKITLDLIFSDKYLIKEN